MNPHGTSEPAQGAPQRVRISCPGCGRNDYVKWPPFKDTYHWKCFNCHKEFDLKKPESGGH